MSPLLSPPPRHELVLSLHGLQYERHPYPGVEGSGFQGSGHEVKLPSLANCVGQRLKESDLPYNISLNSLSTLKENRRL